MTVREKEVEGTVTYERDIVDSVAESLMVLLYRISAPHKQRNPASSGLKMLGMSRSSTRVRQCIGSIS